MYLNHRQESEPEPWSVVTRSCTLNVFHSLKEKVSEHNPGSDYVDHRNVLMNLVIHKCHFCGDVDMFSKRSQWMNSNNPFSPVCQEIYDYFF